MQDIAGFIEQIEKLPVHERTELMGLLQRINDLEGTQKAKNDFITFSKRMWPVFMENTHHRIMAKAFERVVTGECKRLMIHMPPRHTKSEFASWLLPAFYLGHHPARKIIMASHTAELSVGFGRRVRNLINSVEYREVFPNVSLQADNKAAGRWNTNHGGEYYAVGVGGSIAGRGAHLFVIDDPHNEQDAISGNHDPAVFDKVFDWYTSGPRQRLQPGAAIVVVCTRWSKRDLPGRILQRASEHERGPKWEVIEFPAIMPSGRALWPEFWGMDELLAIKADTESWKWNAQYMQNPTSEEGALIKREWWRSWDKKRPDCEAIMVSWDTAFTKNQRSDYSACTIWGVFSGVSSEGKNQSNLILLDAFREKMEFPELKAKAKSIYKEWSPDTMIVEAKAAGAPLIYELRASGIPVTDFTPTRGSDKVARVNAVSDMFKSGLIWYIPSEINQEVVEECASFPAGEHDDFVDTTTQALLRFRQGGWLGFGPEDEDEETELEESVEYY